MGKSREEFQGRRGREDLAHVDQGAEGLGSSLLAISGPFKNQMPDQHSFSAGG